MRGIVRPIVLTCNGNVTNITDTTSLSARGAAGGRRTRPDGQPADGRRTRSDGERSRRAILDAMIQRFESPRPAPWQLGLDRKRLDAVVAAIVGFRLKLRRVEAKFKLSQNRSRDDRMRVAAALDAEAYADAAATASQSSLDLSELLKRLGQADGLQLADTRHALVEAELDREQARLAQGLAYVALYKALGGAPLPKAVAAASGANRP